VLGAAVVGQLLTVRGRFHAEMLLGQAALVGNYVPDSLEPGQLMRIVSQQSLVLSIADAYRVLGVLALLLIPIVLRLNYIPPPDLRPVSRPSTVPSSIQG
jgi:DHA2 family multidrug resistance protein